MSRLLSLISILLPDFYSASGNWLYIPVYTTAAVLLWQWWCSWAVGREEIDHTGIRAVSQMSAVWTGLLFSPSGASEYMSEIPGCECLFYTGTVVRISIKFSNIRSDVSCHII